MSLAKPLRLFFLRHGQTVDYQKKPLNGWRDAQLTDLGRKQLDTAAESLRSIEFEAIYASDLSRAVYGAEKIAQGRGLEVVQSAKWREMSFGLWEGKLYEHLEAEEPELVRAIFQAGNKNTAFPDGESPIIFHDRIVDSFQDLVTKHPQGGNVALVAHSGVAKALWCHMLKIPLESSWSIRQDFAALNVAVIYPGGFCEALVMNAYLGPEGYSRPGCGLNRLI